jgi:hypothetical protein
MTVPTGPASLSALFFTSAARERVWRHLDALLEGLPEEGACVAGLADCCYFLRASTDGHDERLPRRRVHRARQAAR